MSAQTNASEHTPRLQGLLIEDGSRPEADTLLADLVLPRLDTPPVTGLYLRLDTGKLALCLAEAARTTAVRADFVTGRTGYRAARVSARRELIARACGLHRKHGLRILDATAGLGRDALVLAAAGAHVTLLERSPVVAALLDDALRRAADAPAVRDAAARMRLIRIDAAAFLPTLPPHQHPDVICLDPMYPSRRRGGQAGKEMQMLQRLLGASADAAPLLTMARTAAPRVVVKRRSHAPPLGGQPPHHSLAGRGTRFDVYQRPPAT